MSIVEQLTEDIIAKSPLIRWMEVDKDTLLDTNKIYLVMLKLPDEEDNIFIDKGERMLLIIYYQKYAGWIDTNRDRVDEINETLSHYAELGLPLDINPIRKYRHQELYFKQKKK